MSNSQNPWQELKPPTTDHMTYLTFIEHNVNEESLPQLHKVLQDAELNAGIGWDLVHILLPLVPASEECLLDIARLGNPREVVLKVSEALRLLEHHDSYGPSDGDSEIEEQLEELTGAESSKKGASKNPPQVPVSEADLPQPLLKFKALLTMLSVLHPRIKTKYPSRFLSTTLQAVLASYPKSSPYQDELTYEVIKFVKTLAGAKRPHLPPRSKSSQILSSYSDIRGPDPEAQVEKPSGDENEMQNRLLQSFLSHIMEDYILSLRSIDDIPGLAWSSRLQEKLQPQMTVPNKALTEKFARSEQQKNRSATVGSIAALAQDLDLGLDELYEAIVDPEPEISGDGDEDDPPESPKDVPLSKTGALFLFTARKAGEALYDGPESSPSVAIFPDHATIVVNFLGGASKQSMGLEPEPLVDAVLFLGLLALENNDVGEPPSDEAFCEYLQNISLLSSNSPSPNLRYHAHYLTSTVLRSHPHDLVRLSFIRDTLEHCPYENLKTSAVGWLKGETMEANPPGGPSIEVKETASIFATPVAISTLSPFLFPDLTDKLTREPLSQTYVQFKADFSFYLAVLNFYYLLLISKQLQKPLDVAGFQKSSDIESRLLVPLKGAATRYREALKEGGELSDGSSDSQSLVELDLLEDVIKHVVGVIKPLGKS